MCACAEWYDADYGGYVSDCHHLHGSQSGPGLGLVGRVVLEVETSLFRYDVVHYELGKIQVSCRGEAWELSPILPGYLEIVDVKSSDWAKVLWSDPQMASEPDLPLDDALCRMVGRMEEDLLNGLATSATEILEAR